MGSFVPQNATRTVSYDTVPLHLLDRIISVSQFPEYFFCMLTKVRWRSVDLDKDQLIFDRCIEVITFIFDPS